MTPEQLNEFKSAAIKAYPNEAGGVVFGDTLFVLPNVSPTPSEAMEFDGALLTKLELHHGKMKSMIHSHIIDPTKMANPMNRREPNWASSQDMRTWIALKVPFGILATDGEGCSDVLWYDDNNRAPLLGRTFSHGLHDCYSVIRDHFWFELNIDLPNYPRGYDWWNAGENLYLDNFENAGFVEVPLEQARTNDVLLYAIGTRVPNHASVFIEPNGIIHHLIDRLSRVDQRTKWARCEVKALRHSSLM